MHTGAFNPPHLAIGTIQRTIFVVGVHIRRGDYKTWEGGKYYFEHQEYAEQMEAVATIGSRMAMQ